MHDEDPKRQFAVEVIGRLKEAGYEAFWAGGCVRDFLLGRAPGDYDVATSAHPKQVRELFGHRRTIAVGASFGVIVVIGPKASGNVEVATFRSEGQYLDGRRPESIVFTTAEEDAQRRDFTINGMFYDPVDRRVIDYVGGEQDLARNVVRAIGDPHDRVREDKLRMLRAVRFTATLDFELDSTTAQAIAEMADQILVVSAERIAQELRKMLIDQHRTRAMRLAAEVGLLPVIVPELLPLFDSSDDPNSPDQWEQTLHMLQLLPDAGFELAAAVLLHTLPAGETEKKSPQEGTVRGICKRLKLSNHELDHIHWLVAHRHDLIDAPRMSQAHLKRLMIHPHMRDLLELFRAERIATNSDLTPLAFAEEFYHGTPDEEMNPKPLLTGGDLIDSGIQPGPRFKEILDTIRDAQLNGELNTREEALSLLTRLQSDS